MANLHTSFAEYNKIIRLSDEKRQELVDVRNDLRQRILTRHYLFAGAQSIYDIIQFQSQGSYEMDTIINPTRGDYDLDDGIYFIGNLPRAKRPGTEVFHKQIIDAIGSKYGEVEKVIDKNTCVRVLFKDGYHIDLPVYYAGDWRCPDLADKAKGWILSNPVEFIAWFEEKAQSGFQKSFLYESKLFDEYQRWLSDIRKKDVQLRRLVRFLKSWGDLRREEMPCGLIMTILVANNYYSHDRDDVALAETLVLIEASLRKSFTCLRPTTPEGEDLLASYPHKDAFLRYLRQFIENAKKALSESDPSQACKSWQKSLGDRFPCPTDYSSIHIKGQSTAGLVAGSQMSKPYGFQYEYRI